MFLKIPKVSSIVYHSYHLYPLLVDFSKINIDKVKLFNKMLKNNISLQVHYIPIHTQPYYSRKYDYSQSDFSCAEKILQSGNIFAYIPYFI